MRAVLAALILVLAAAVPCRAQQAVARMSASASVVMPVTVGGGEVALSQAAGGVDVTRPLSVGGTVPWVLEVVEGASTDAGARRLTRAGFVRPKSATSPAAEQPVTVRLSDAKPADAAPAAPRPVTYVVATVN